MAKQTNEMYIRKKVRHKKKKEKKEKPKERKQKRVKTALNKPGQATRCVRNGSMVFPARIPVFGGFAELLMDGHMHELTDGQTDGGTHILIEMRGRI